MTAQESLKKWYEIRIKAMEAEILKLNLLLIGYKLTIDYQRKLNKINYEKKGNENRKPKN